MTPSALILSPLQDPNAAVLAFSLRRCGLEVLWRPSLDGLHLSLAPDPVRGWAARGPGLGELRSVWYRRPRRPQPMEGVAPCDAAFVADEWDLFQRNLFAMGPELTGALWVNGPQAAVRAENKLLQLRAAEAVGLRLPATLLSNEPEAVRAFLRAQGRVIFKTFSAHTWKDAETGELVNSAAVLLEDPAELQDASIALCPGIYQAYVDKVADLRVTVIGGRCFAARIAKAEGGAFVDWRPRTYMPDLKAEACALPVDIERRIQGLMAALDLSFGCVDLVLDRQGELHFLEVNQGGQFLFVEELVPELPLVRALCSMLAQGRKDYALLPGDELSLAACLASAEYQDWKLRNQPAQGVEALEATLE